MPYRIYVVEDHPVMRRAYAQLLEGEEHLALCGAAETAEDAEAWLAEASCDVVVTDIALPGMDGITLVERLRATHPDLPTVVVSGHEGPAFVARARRAGAHAFLSKRHLAQAFGDTVRAVIGGAAPLQQGA